MLVCRVPVVAESLPLRWSRLVIILARVVDPMLQWSLVTTMTAFCTQALNLALPLEFKAKDDSRR